MPKRAYFIICVLMISLVLLQESSADILENTVDSQTGYHNIDMSIDISDTPGTSYQFLYILHQVNSPSTRIPITMIAPLLQEIGEDIAFEPEEAETLPETFPAPAELTGRAAANIVTLMWDEPEDTYTSDILGYFISRKLSIESSFHQIGYVSSSYESNVYIDTLIYAGNYDFMVEADLPTGLSTPSNSISLQVNQVSAPNFTPP
ncbi:MAG: hypothetical protein FWG20_01805, partial [Candidatus Cloacimonetes bacterium]|nr:hypothetical protein [Candidatus Cloacimonadota bacterium]